MLFDRFIITLIALVVCFFPANITSIEAYNLPDTGQTKCYNNTEELQSCPSPGEPFYGQDANYHGPQPALNDNGDDTITDLNTGLVWQESDEQNDGGERTWQDAVDYCSGLDLADHTDWYLPSRMELLSITNYRWSRPAVDMTFFPNCRSDSYWTATARADAPDYDAWDTNFYYGDAHVFGKGLDFFVRCTRGVPLISSFRNNNNGTVTDTTTSLVWQQGDSQNYNGGRTWEQALQYCEGLSLTEHKDWRLPNIRELNSLVDDQRHAPAINPIFVARSDRYWSSTTHPQGASYAWCVDFYWGSPHSYNRGGKGNELLYVRCVTGPFGTLKVTISPQAAIDVGVQWRVDGGTWQNSGDSLPDLVIGEHALEFKKIPGWVAPMTRTVTISTNQTTTITETYRPVKPLSPILLMLD